METSGYFGRLIGALLGRVPDAAAQTDADTGSAEFRAQLAALRLDIDDRDRRIEAMQKEYAALQTSKEKAAGDAGLEQLDRLFKKLSGPMSNLAALADLGKSGREVAASDLLGLFQSLEKELAHAGMERIGTTGEATVFDTALHQRMSGGAVHAGTQVVIRVPGYRHGERILLKAMVSAREGR